MIYILAGTGAEAEAYAKDHGIGPGQREFVNGAPFFRSHAHKAGDQFILVGTWESRDDLAVLRARAAEAGFAWPDPSVEVNTAPLASPPISKAKPFRP